MAAPGLPIGLNLDPLTHGLFGLMLIGMALSATLYGVTCLQTFIYFRTPNCDRWYIPSLVLVLLLLDTIHQALSIYILWSYVLNTWGGNFGAFSENSWSLPTSLFLNVVVAFLVDTYLLCRLYRVSGNKYYCGIIGLLLIGHLGLNFAFVIRLRINDAFLANILLPSGGLTKALVPHKLQARATPGVTALVPEAYFNIAVAGLVVDCAIDLMLALGLVYHLNSSRSGLKRTEDFITRLIVMTISTGLLTSAAAMAEMITLNLASIYAGGVFIALNFVIGKLYINALLTSLNTRGGLASSLRDKGTTMSLTNGQESRFVTRSLTIKTLDISRSRTVGTPLHFEASNDSSEGQYPPPKYAYAI